MARKKRVRSVAEIAFIVLYLPAILLMYLVYKYPLLFVDNANDVFLLGKHPGFWYNFIYTSLVCGIAAWVVFRKYNPYRKGKGSTPINSYQRNKFISIFMVQLIFFFALPYVIPGMKNPNGFFDDRKFTEVPRFLGDFKEGDAIYQGLPFYRDAASGESNIFEVRDINGSKITIEAQATDIFGHRETRLIEDQNYNFMKDAYIVQDGYQLHADPQPDNTGRIGVIHSVNDKTYTILLDPSNSKNAYVYVYNGFTSTGGFVYIFILVPFIVWFTGKRYCSWFCACGNLAETVGITKWGSEWVREYTPRGEKSRKLEFIQYMFLVWAIAFGIILFIDAWKLFTIGNLATGMRVYQDIVVDLMFGALIGVGAYPFMGTRIWCRYGCPLAAGMRLYGKFTHSKYKIIANENCTGIGECTRVCPMGINVEDYAHKNNKPVMGDFGLEDTTCIGCGGCVSVCPRDALIFDKVVGRSITEKEQVS